MSISLSDFLHSAPASLYSLGQLLRPSSETALGLGQLDPPPQDRQPGQLYQLDREPATRVCAQGRHLRPLREIHRQGRRLGVVEGEQ
jgi:hypothetical protein